MEFPKDFRCPISMRLMKDPATISTGVTYERKNIEKWFFIYKKKTCPVTKQIIENFGITPNHTLRRLISAWKIMQPPSSRSSTSYKRNKMVSLLKILRSNPFNVSSLRKLNRIVEIEDEMRVEFVRLGGLEVLSRIIVYILSYNWDFMFFRACEEALRVLQYLPIWQDDGKVFEIFLKPEFMKSLVFILQRGRKEGRVATVVTLTKLANSNYNWNVVVNDEGIGMFKSMLKLASEKISIKTSTYVFQVLIKILESSKKNRSIAIEAGAMGTLIELLPDSNKSECENILRIIKLLCECVEGKMAFSEHGLGIGALSCKLLNVSWLASELCLEIILLVCGYNPSKKDWEEMIIYGTVKKRVISTHINRPSLKKNKMIGMLKGNSYSRSRYPYFHSEMKGYRGSRRR